MPHQSEFLVQPYLLHLKQHFTMGSSLGDIDPLALVVGLLIKNIIKITK